MANYKFMDCTVGGVNVINGWLSQQPDKVQAAFISLLEHLEGIPLDLWEGRPGYKKMQGERFNGLREFYVDIEGRHYRLGAFRGLAKGEMTLLSGWIHDSEQAQRIGMEDALTRRDLVRRGRAGRVDHVS